MRSHEKFIHPTAIMFCLTGEKYPPEQLKLRIYEVDFQQTRLD